MQVVLLNSVRRGALRLERGSRVSLADGLAAELVREGVAVPWTAPEKAGVWTGAKTLEALAPPPVDPDKKPERAGAWHQVEDLFSFRVLLGVRGGLVL